MDKTLPTQPTSTTSLPTAPSKDLSNVPDPTELLKSLNIKNPPMPPSPPTNTPRVLTTEETHDSHPQGEQIDTKITDFEGRFGFLVEKGKYILHVNKSGYRFPSRVLQGKREDFDRKNLYFGETLSIDNPDLVDVSIPIDPVSFNWNQASKPKQYHPPLIPFKEHLYSILSILGLIFSFFVYLMSPTPFNLAFLFGYILLFIIYRFSPPKKWGIVYHSFSKNVLPLVTVRAIKQGGAVAGFCQTDHRGRYFLLLPEGEHTLQVEQDLGNGQVKVLGKQHVDVPKNKPLVTVDIAI